MKKIESTLKKVISNKIKHISNNKNFCLAKDLNTKPKKNNVKHIIIVSGNKNLVQANVNGEMDKIINKLINKKLKTNILQLEYNSFSKNNWLNWLT